MEPHMRERGCSIRWRPLLSHSVTSATMPTLLKLTGHLWRFLTGLVALWPHHKAADSIDAALKRCRDSLTTVRGLTVRHHPHHLARWWCAHALRARTPL
eukprot:gene11376-biopygen805